MKVEIDREETTAETLYDQLSHISGKRFVKYVLDKNRTDNALFCVDPAIIEETTNASSIDTRVKPFIFKSRYKGLFDDYDDNRQSLPNNNDGAIKNTDDCCHKDHVDYFVTKNDCELLEIQTLGVKNLSQTNRNYKTVYSYEDEIDIPIQFMPDQRYKGLTLFNRVIIEMVSDDLETLRNTALQVIDTVFSLRCDRYANIYGPTSSHMRSVSVRWTEPAKFPKALYDFKRAMDYLPVKATKNANNQFGTHDMIYFHVSSDRLAIAYAILSGCPCILVENGGETFHVYNPKGPREMVGGITASRVKTKTTLPKSQSESKRTEEDMESYEDYMRMRLEDLLPAKGNPKSNFEAFLVRYKKVFKETKIDYFWYAVYRFLFFCLEKMDVPCR